MNNPVTIYLADLVHDMFPGNYVVPLNISYIAAYAKSILGDDIVVTLFKSPTSLLKSIRKRAPDVLALSNYMWNRHLNMQLALEIKKNFPEIIIAMGGPGTRTNEPGITEFLREHHYVDIYMLFEGEKPFVNFLSTILSSSNLGSKKHRIFGDSRVIGGCAYLMADESIYSPHDILTRLETIPSPYLTGHLDEFLEEGFIPLFESNRGCPFSCSFCNWGVSALRKVRTFPIERIFDEMEYVAKKNPSIPYWNVADANFGLLERDVQIAEKIISFKKQLPSLGKVVTWASKSRSPNNMKISRILNSERIGDVERQLIAVQSFDPKVLKANRISTLRLEEVPSLVKELHAQGIEASTCVIFGLPEETADSHMQTLRKCFEVGFDYIVLHNAILLPGSPLESDATRRQHALKTKFRLRKGSYGIYEGIKAAECEEIIVGSSTMTQEEFVRFRIVHWLIWFCWNTNLIKPLLQYLYSYYGINPVDVITKLVEYKDTSSKEIQDIFEQFKLETVKEFFHDSNAIYDFVNDNERFAELLNGRFPKLNYKYTAMIMLDVSLYKKFCNFMFEASTALIDRQIPKDILTMTSEMLIDIRAAMNGGARMEKVLKVGNELITFLFKDASIDEISNGIRLSIPKENLILLKNVLNKFGFAEDNHLAIEKSLEFFYPVFSYHLALN